MFLDDIHLTNLQPELGSHVVRKEGDESINLSQKLCFAEIITSATRIFMSFCLFNIFFQAYSIGALSLVSFLGLLLAKKMGECPGIVEASS
jgi:hypothetical protein